jgi:hypothetical protein
MLALSGTCTSPLPYDQHISEEASVHEEPLAAGEQIQQRAHKHVAKLHPTSSQNPYFGYPAMREDRTRHGLQHSRKRKRDLIRTLIWLFFMRSRERLLSIYWRTRRSILGSPKVSLCCLILVCFLLRYRLRRLITGV